MRFLEKIFGSTNSKLSKVNIIGKGNETSPSDIKSSVIYNTKDNFIVLIQYGSDYFYSMIEFLSIVSKIPSIQALTSNASIEVQEKEDEEDFSKKPIKLTDTKYYTIIAGSEFHELYKHLDLSNSILQEITNDIYEYRCNDVDFSILTGNRVLDQFRFKYGSTVPPWESRVDGGNNVTYDDLNVVLSRLPNVFEKIDIIKLLKVTYKDCGKWHTVYTPEFIAHAPYLTPVMDAYFGKDNVFEDVYASLFDPIYRREVVDPEDDEDSGMLPPEKLDSIFQQSYDRFTIPTADVMETMDMIDEAATPEEK